MGVNERRPAAKRNEDSAGTVVFLFFSFFFFKYLDDVLTPPVLSGRA